MKLGVHFRACVTFFCVIYATLTMAEEETEEKKEVLLLMGKMFPMDLTAGEFMINGMPIFVKEVENAGTGTGNNVWDGVFSLFLFFLFFKFFSFFPLVHSTCKVYGAQFTFVLRGQNRC